MNKHIIEKVFSKDYPEVIDVWEASVRATHHFLKEEDIAYFKPIILNEYLQTVNIFCIRNESGEMQGFIGISGKNIDMLFIHPSSRGKGLGTSLTFFAINNHHTETVDVNEQNEEALGFYKKIGFEVISRDAFDSAGKPYPILHMKLTNPSLFHKYNKTQIEIHPLGFFLPDNTHLLMLGSFPPKREKWSMNFYYPNIINDMWRIIGLVFYNDKSYFLSPGYKSYSEEKARQFCIEKGIGIGDTAEEIVRLKDNASDKFLEVVKPFNPDKVFRMIPECHTVVITGQKAMDTFLSVVPAIEPKVGCYTNFCYAGKTYKLYRMPSSSRAYPLSIEKKAETYRNMFLDTGILQE